MARALRLGKGRRAGCAQQREIRRAERLGRLVLGYRITYERTGLDNEISSKL